jgi:hypothetical protein
MKTKDPEFHNFFYILAIAVSSVLSIGLAEQDKIHCKVLKCITSHPIVNQ